MRSRRQSTFLSGQSREPEPDLRLRLRPITLHTKNLKFFKFCLQNKMCTFFSGRSRSRGAGATRFRGSEPEPSKYDGSATLLLALRILNERTGIMQCCGSGSCPDPLKCIRIRYTGYWINTIRSIPASGHPNPNC